MIRALEAEDAERDNGEFWDEGSGKASLEPTGKQRPEQVRNQITSQHGESVWAEEGTAGAKALSWKPDHPELCSEASAARAERERWTAMSWQGAESGA